MIHVWWAQLGPDLQAAAIGAVTTVVSTVVGVLLVRAQIRNSAQQSREATSLQHQQAIRIELYRDIADCVAKAHDLEGELTFAVHGVLARLQGKSWAKPVHGPVAEMNQFEQVVQASYALSQALAELLITFERWEIAEPRLSLFHAAMNSAAHNLSTTAQQLTAIALAVGDVRINAARQMQPEGELQSLPPFDRQQIEAFEFAVTQLLRAVSEAGGYVHDTRIELQNLLLADIFKHKVPPRKPLDPTIIPLSLGQASELEDYFLNRSPWGIQMAEVNARTKADIDKRADEPRP